MLRWLRLLLASALALCSSAAWAEWRVSSGPQATILFEHVPHETTLLFGCADGYFSFGVGSEYLGALPEEEGEAYLSIQVDAGVLWQSAATYKRNEYGGFDVIYNQTTDVPAIIGEVIAAKSAIKVELQHMLYGERFEWTAGAKGSTKAGNELMAICGTPKVTAAAVPGATTWTTTIGPDAENGGEQAFLIAGLEHGAKLLATCNSRSQVTLSVLAASLPYALGDVGLNLHVNVDGEDRSATGQFFEYQDGLVGVAYTGEYVANAIKAIGGAKTGVKLSVQNYADNSVKEWMAIDLEGHDAAIDAFSTKCFGTQPVQQAAVESTPWQLMQLDADTELRASLVASGPNNSHFLEVTCSLDASAWTLGIFAEYPPFDPEEGPYAFKVTIDDYSWDLAETTSVREGVDLGLIATHKDVAELLTVLSLPHDTITVEAIDYTGKSFPFVYAAGGAADLAGSMFNKCYGLS